MRRAGGIPVGAGVNYRTETSKTSPNVERTQGRSSVNHTTDGGETGVMRNNLPLDLD